MKTTKGGHTEISVLFLRSPCSPCENVCVCVCVWGGVLLGEGREHAEVSKVLDVVVGCSLRRVSGHGQHVLETEGDTQLSGQAGELYHKQAVDPGPGLISLTWPLIGHLIQITVHNPQLSRWA